MSNPSNYLNIYQTRQRDKRSTYYRQITQTNHGKSSSSRIRFLLVSLGKILPRAAIASSLLFVLQCFYVICKTPRLPPPPLSGFDFPKEGLVATSHEENTWAESQKDSEKEKNSLKDDTSHDNATACHKRNTQISRQSNEFRLILIGDSPVEGIGNRDHSSALCGQTAKAFAKVVCRSNNTSRRPNTPQFDEVYDRVRYWSFGKSGLTARGIQDEMVPLLHSTFDRILECYHDSTQSNDEPPSSLTIDEESVIHAIVLLCGVNNVLSPQCTPSSFSSEVSSLLSSIRKHACLRQTPILVLGLPNFSKLPFLPSWPMGWILGVRGRRMQSALEGLVEEIQREERLESGRTKTIMVPIPEVQDMIDSKGYYRRDGHSSASDDKQSPCSNQIMSKDDMDKKDSYNQLGLRFYHPLEKHLGNDVIHPKTITSLGINDFLCDDGFHPGRHGTVFIGSLLSDAYRKWTCRP
ncbi:hypothetical protein HJC23_012006 [Cyclotella cryptica]|uniref:SGNH hydrolase-type esterase domain-containing protein n=1 Tax=Cyclotella cryptica TaxID=29204 RepID=A0ABD3QR17_9STRA|eukprot:CCRYP_003082-RA/>CCRYP_003082-RA protein AED:0.00 eAED:0.00 QI:401/1/1/1/0/0/2/1378/464